MLEILLSYDAINAPDEVYSVCCFKQITLFKKLAFNFKHTNWAPQLNNKLWALLAEQNYHNVYGQERLHKIWRAKVMARMYKIVTCIILHINMKNKINAHVIMPTNMFNYQYNCCDRFDAAHPGEGFARVTPESEEDTFTMWAPSTLLLYSAPDAVVGLDPQRQWYLYNSIREFVTDNDKDTLCPLPSVPRPTTRQIRGSTEEGTGRWSRGWM